jgi:hypothetical protein
MAHDQRYVSDELCHFVGKGKPEDQQYDILVNKILKSGWITHGPHHNPTVPRTAGLDLSKPISTDEAIKYQVVCFCDIPTPDLIIHVSKYSKFGLSFKKPFLIDRGACPVFYVANETPVPAAEVFAPDDFLDRIHEARKKGFVDRALYFDTSVRAIIDLLAALDALSCAESKRYFQGMNVNDCRSRLKSLIGLTDAQILAMTKILTESHIAPGTIRKCIDFLLNYVFTYIKCFDAKRLIDDEKNFYMEREWRVGNNVNFALQDVLRVLFPSKFASRFRADLPQYLGQITFLD